MPFTNTATSAACFVKGRQERHCQVGSTVCYPASQPTTCWSCDGLPQHSHAATRPIWRPYACGMLYYTPDGEVLLQSQPVSRFDYRQWQLHQYTECHSYRS